MAEDLTPFYNDIQKWIDDGFPEHKVFNKDRGLCVSLRLWCEERGLWVFDHRTEMVSSFMDEGLDYLYPFDYGDTCYFWRDVDLGTLYQNPRRLKWIKDHCK